MAAAFPLLRFGWGDVLAPQLEKGAPGNTYYVDYGHRLAAGKTAASSAGDTASGRNAECCECVTRRVREVERRAAAGSRDKPEKVVRFLRCRLEGA